jgi:hypothetical protein
VAGSWQHMTTKSGKLRNNETFNGMIENGGDAYEAAEECFGMIHYLAAILADEVPGVTRQQLIQQAEEHYKDGLRLGGVQRS